MNQPTLECESRPATPRSRGIVIATINRRHGNTGVHTHTAALCDGLRAVEVPCDVVTPFDNGPHWLAVFAVRPLLLNPIFPSRSIHWYRHWHGAGLRHALRRYLSAHDVSHVIAQCPVSAKAALDVRRDRGRPAFTITMVCHFNHSEALEYRELGQLEDEPAYQRMLDFEAGIMRAVDRVVYVSQWAQKVVEQDRGIVPRASAVIHNGVESPPGPAPAVSRQAIPAAPADLLLINVGSLERRKNQLGLLDLFAAVVAREPRALLLLVGEGPDRAAIERRAETLGVRARVKLLGHRRDVAALLGSADLYVHYASAENCPMVILEAARAGLPWAAVPAAGVEELQRLIGGCVTIDPQDLSNATAAVLSLLRDSARRNRLGDTARARFLDGFTRQHMVRSYLRLEDGAPPAAATSKGAA
jgi:glycosyltransferase involved in cell wall biosynthesis